MVFRIFRNMKVIREDKKISISFSESLLETSEIQSLLDYIKFREINSLSKATENDANSLSDEINRGWWKNNRDKFE